MKRNRVKELRRARNKMSQAQLGHEIGVSQQTISRAESGDLASDVLINLSRYFNVSTDYILGVSDTPLPDKQSNAFVQDFVASHPEFVQELLKLNDEGVEMADSLIKSLTESRFFNKKKKRKKKTES